MFHLFFLRGNREFERFEKEFEECISQSAIRTRFQTHAQEGIQRAELVAAALADLEGRIGRNTDRVRAHVAEQEKYLRILDSQAATVLRKLKHDIGSVAKALLPEIMRSLEHDSLLELNHAVEDFYYPSFKPENATVMLEYQNTLTLSVQHRLNEEVAIRVSAKLAERFTQLQQVVQLSLLFFVLSLASFFFCPGLYFVKQKGRSDIIAALAF